MSVISAVPNDVEQYLDAVRAELADLPTGERDDLLSEVEASLLESAEDAGGPIAARLGPPADFAAELRAAAGLHAPASRPLQGGLAQFVRDAREWLADDPRARAAARVAHELAPIWWVARGYFAVGFLAFAVDAQWSDSWPFVPLFESGPTGVVSIGVGVLASVALGLYGRLRGSTVPPLVVALNVLLLAGAAVVISDVLANAGRESSVQVVAADPPPGLLYDGVPVDNVYPYSRDGRLLHDVLLFDGAGRPLELVRADDPTRRVLTTPEGKPVLNAYPVRYFEPDTREVAQPNASPVVEIPEIVTPPLVPASGGR